MSNEKVGKSSVMFTTTDDAKNFGFILGDGDADDREVVATFTTVMDAMDLVARSLGSGLDDYTEEESRAIISKLGRFIWDECGDPGENGKKYMYDDHPWCSMSGDDVWSLAESK